MPQNLDNEVGTTRYSKEKSPATPCSLRVYIQLVFEAAGIGEACASAVLLYCAHLYEPGWTLGV